MATLMDGANIVGDANFQKRVGVAVYFVAREVMTESTETPHYPLRVRYAQNVVTQDLSMMLKYAALVVTSPTISSKTSAQLANQTNITDLEIIEAVRAMWNPLSGVAE